MVPVSPSLETATLAYAKSLHELIATLRMAQAQLQLVTKKGEELGALLADVGSVLSRQPPTDGTEHALAMLAWVLRTGEDTRLLLDAAIGTHTRVLPRLAVLRNVASDLSAAVRAASAPSQPTAFEAQIGTR